MLSRRILVVALVGLLLMANVTCQPKTYTVHISRISQIGASRPFSISGAGERYYTYSGIPLFVEFTATGFECPRQDMSFMVSYLYRKVRPANFLEDPSLFVMEGFLTTTTVMSESCSSSWTSPPLRDGIHTIGVLAFDGSGAQSAWYYVTIVKNNDRDAGVSYFPGGDPNTSTKGEEPPVSGDPSVIIDTPSHNFKIGQDPVQYVDIRFHTNFPFLIEYFYVEWTFVSQNGCRYESSAIVYPTEGNEGFFRLDMSSVFVSEVDEPQDNYGKCKFGAGEFFVSISCKTSLGLGKSSSVSIRLV
ncbi:MAG: hypothetical protein HXS44_09900 [Theionarchaea archaeon]|nr:hypothetical protein [Theionarchaea archaeon]